MTTEQFNKFVATVAEMREQQRRFFAAQVGSKERQDALIQSKALEREVDTTLTNIRNPPPPTLFS